MKIKLYSLLSLIFFASLLMNAQNNVQAEKIISEILTNAKVNAIKTNFKLIVSNKDDNQPQSSSGVFTLRGSKFVLEMDEMKVWFDGKTQWAYVSQNKEVSITEPTEKELSETNPLAILSAYKSKCNINYSPSKSTSIYSIEMIPKVKNKELEKIYIQVNKSNLNLISIKQLSKNGNSTFVTFSDYQKNITVPDNAFTFNAAKFKNVVINDLR